jgi:hypothetical protein
MLVRMTTQMLGAVDGREPPAPGELFDVPADEGERMLAAGQAVLPDGSGQRSYEPLATPWPGVLRLVLPEDPDASGSVRTDGRALTGRTGLVRS